MFSVQFFVDPSEVAVMIVLSVMVDVIHNVKNIGSWVLNKCFCDKGMNGPGGHSLLNVHRNLSVACTCETSMGDFPRFRTDRPVVPNEVTRADFLFSHF